jgi:hypothetical protein
MNRNKLYGLLLIACFLGYGYLYYKTFGIEDETVQVCLIKNVTGYPCPSCGTTRAVLLLFEGNLLDSFLLNPFGILVVFIMTVIPLWIIIDVLQKKARFFNAYKKVESIIQKPWIALILIFLVLFNWIWNIYKQL